MLSPHALGLSLMLPPNPVHSGRPIVPQAQARCKHFVPRLPLRDPGALRQRLRVYSPRVFRRRGPAAACPGVVHHEVVARRRPVCEEDAVTVSIPLLSHASTKSVAHLRCSSRTRLSRTLDERLSALREFGV